MVGLTALVVLGLAACTSTTSSQESSDASGGSTASAPARVERVRLDLVDPSRPAVDPKGARSAPVRALPTDLYLPTGNGPRPLILFAHGFDGDPGKFTKLLHRWAAAGFVVAAPRFPVTATGAGREGIALAADYVQQPADVRFVLDELLRGKYAPWIDARHIGAAGLSLGGGTTWALTENSCCRDRRIDAAIVMDGLQFGFADGKFGPNRIPLLVYHADGDPSLPYQAARDAYARAVAPKWFVTLFGVMHAQPFEDSPSPADATVERTTTDFWRAQLLGDTRAGTRLVHEATVPGVSRAEATTR